MLPLNFYQNNFTSCILGYEYPLLRPCTASGLKKQISDILDLWVTLTPVYRNRIVYRSDLFSSAITTRLRTSAGIFSGDTSSRCVKVFNRRKPLGKIQVYFSSPGAQYSSNFGHNAGYFALTSAAVGTWRSL